MPSSFAPTTTIHRACAAVPDCTTGQTAGTQPAPAWDTIPATTDKHALLIYKALNVLVTPGSVVELLVPNARIDDRFIQYSRRLLRLR